MMKLNKAKSSALALKKKRKEEDKEAVKSLAKVGVFTPI